MNTPQLVERPTKKQPNFTKILQRITTFWMMFYIAAAIMFVAGNEVPKRHVIEHTSAMYGWVHGFYLIPDFIASLGSDKHAIYQAGASPGYDVMFVIGVLLMVLTIKNFVSARRSRMKQCCLDMPFFS